MVHAAGMKVSAANGRPIARNRASRIDSDQVAGVISNPSWNTNPVE